MKRATPSTPVVCCACCEHRDDVDGCGHPAAGDRVLDVAFHRHQRQRPTWCPLRGAPKAEQLAAVRGAIARGSKLERLAAMLEAMPNGAFPLPAHLRPPTTCDHTDDAGSMP